LKTITRVFEVRTGSSNTSASACRNRSSLSAAVRIDAFASAFEGSEKYFQQTRDGHALVDLHLANKDQLLSCGVPLDAICIAPFCTMDRPDLFFSYRLEKKKFGKTGRLLSVIGQR
jgi:copper oxidase (laccase) domain-containing protein